MGANSRLVNSTSVPLRDLRTRHIEKGDFILLQDPEQPGVYFTIMVESIVGEMPENRLIRGVVVDIRNSNRSLNEQVALQIITEGKPVFGYVASSDDETEKIPVTDLSSVMYGVVSHLRSRELYNYRDSISAVLLHLKGLDLVPADMSQLDFVTLLKRANRLSNKVLAIRNGYIHIAKHDMTSGVSLGSTSGITVIDQVTFNEGFDLVKRGIEKLLKSGILGRVEFK